MKKNPYKFFEDYVLRAPLFSFSSYEKLTSDKSISDDELYEILNDQTFREALFLSSPPLSAELNRFLNNEITDPKKVNKLKSSLLKYISRMSSRCTPFGILAGCSMGSFEDKTDIQLTDFEDYRRKTGLDMHFLVDLSQKLAKNEIIKNQLHFFPNTSIYKIGNQLRYIEYKYLNGRRKHSIAEVDSNEYLDLLLEKAKDGALLEDLAMLLVDDEITLEDAKEFIEELIDNQLLISDLEPSVSGPEFLEQVCQVISQLEGVDDIYNVLISVKNKLVKLDQSTHNSINDYQDIENELKNIHSDFDSKYLFQTDLLLTNKKNTLDKKLLGNLSKALSVLNSLSIQSSGSHLNTFLNDFTKRYEEKPVSLSTVMDIETGIGYKQTNQGDLSPLLEGIVVPGRVSQSSMIDVKWSQQHSLFQKKIIDAYKKDEYAIKVSQEDLNKFDSSWDNLPDTISFIIQIFEENGEEKILFKGGGSSSGANLLGRFCYLDEKINAHTQNIIDVESEINKDKVLAEIVHLPESRVGNILMRPSFRKYEIPYLAKSLKAKDNQVPIEDIEVSVKRKKILLKSKRLNKEIIPRMSNAHNYSANSLPIYNFLCDMQIHQKRVGIGLSIKQVENEFDFIPRIEFENIVIKEARWNLTKKHVKDLFDNMNSDDHLMSAAQKFREDFKVPRYVLLEERDNRLLLNLNNLDSIKMFLNTIKKRQGFSLIEFLHADAGIVKKGLNYYTNEFIVTCYNKEKLNESRTDES